MPATRQRQPLFRHGTTRLGLLVAGTVLLVFTVIVLIFVVRSPSRATGQAVTTGTGPAPDIKQLPGDPEGINSLKTSGRFLARIVSKDDPTRLDGEISGDRYVPLEQQRFKLERPEGWAFLKSGRTVHIEADTGRTYMPDQGNDARPRDAVLEGHVVIKIFDPKEGGKRPDLAADRPFGVVTTTVLKFDGELNKIELPERFVATTDAGDYTGTGLVVLFNDVEERLELLRIAQTESVRLNPAYKKPTSPPPAAGPASPAPTSPIAGAPAHPTPTGPGRKHPEKTPAETLYHVTCTDTVVVVQAGRRIDAQRLDAWVRTEGNQLRPGAIATSNQTRQDGTAAKTAAPSLSAGSQAGTVNPEPGSAVRRAEPSADSPLFGLDNRDGPITLTWKGPMEVRPLSGVPGELAYNDVFVRFTSDKDGGVRFADQKSDANATGSLLEYGATRREVALASHEPMQAIITQPGSGVAQSQRFELSLASGMAHAPARGMITAQRAGGLPTVGLGGAKDLDPKGDMPLPRSLSWDDQADFRFVMDQNHELTPVISEVHASGNARATDGKSSLSGESLIAQFMPVTPKASRLDRLQVAGHASGDDGRGGALSSDTLDVAFIQTPDKADQSDPSLVTAQGGVRAGREGATLLASYLQARLGRGADQRLEVAHVAARDTTFTNPEGVHAKANRLEADPVAKTAHLTGPPMSVEVSKQGTVVTGEDMTLWQVERKLESRNAGELHHDGPIDEKKNGGDSRPVNAVATWTRGMVFEDGTGQATCLGDVQAVITRPPQATKDGPVGLERDTITGEEVHLTFTAAAPAGPSDSPNGKAERKLLTVQAVGTLEGSPEGTPATVESKKYAPAAPDAEPPLEQLQALRSARINANLKDGTLDAPAAGKLVIEDRRAAPAHAEAPPAGTGAAAPFEASSNARGSTLFTWTGSMTMDRATGRIQLNDHAYLFHRDPGEGAKTELECEKLTAMVREVRRNDAAVSADSFAGELTAADAEGAVWLRSGAHELVADSLHYDAIRKVINARATDTNVVTMFDPKARSPMTAREIEWDLAKDRIEIKKPGPIVAPVAPRR